MIDRPPDNTGDAGPEPPMPLKSKFLALALPLLAIACGSAEEGPVDDVLAGNCTPLEGDDFFATAEACAADPKADTGYVSNLNARELELTLEGDVEATGYAKERAPLQSGQFALTYFRQKKDLYIASLAEESVDGLASVQWKTTAGWKKWSALTASEKSSVKRFKLEKVNAVLMNATKYSPAVGKTFVAPVPLKPTTLYTDVGRTCEGGDGHIQADNSVYWYVWEPTKAGCTAKKVDLTATITNLLPKGGTVYPEYDKLFADKKLDVIVFFGQVDDDPLKDDDLGFDLVWEFENQIKAAGFKKGTATKGLRYSRTKSGFTANIDIYTPREFKGLQDYSNRSNFTDAVASHEIVVWNGHSVLGASDIWADPALYVNPSKYQVFIYNGCLGYEYYVAPILAGKEGAANVDVISNVVETPFAIVSEVTSLALAQIIAKNGSTTAGTSWQTILGKMNTKAKEHAEWAGPSFFGVSAARDNKWKPK